MNIHTLSREERGVAGGGDRVRSLAETAALLGISIATLRRMITAGTGPTVTRLSPRRLGIRDSHRAAYLDANAGRSASA
jgi:hypothetical protein